MWHSGLWACWCHHRHRKNSSSTSRVEPARISGSVYGKRAARETGVHRSELPPPTMSCRAHCGVMSQRPPKRLGHDRAGAVAPQGDSRIKISAHGCRLSLNANRQLGFWPTSSLVVAFLRSSACSSYVIELAFVIRERAFRGAVSINGVSRDPVIWQTYLSRLEDDSRDRLSVDEWVTVIVDDGRKRWLAGPPT